jgi:hypothetical protein
MPYDKDDVMSKEEKNLKRSQFMTYEQMEEVDAMLTQIILNKGEMNFKYGEWADIEEAYKTDQPKVENRPNTRVNIINANIEGQVAALVDQNLAVMCKGESPGDEKFAEWARVGLEWTMRKNKFKSKIAMHERRRLKYGGAIFKASWNQDFFNGFGLAEIFPTPIDMFFIDGKLKDPLCWQGADYMGEIVTISKYKLKEIYGEDKASMVDCGPSYTAQQRAFMEAYRLDDEDAGALILRWSKHKKKLRLQEFTIDGTLLYDSHLAGNRKTQIPKDASESHKSYYKYVNDKYPYIYTFLYPEEGELWGFGDGKLMMPLQKMINDMYDMIRIGAKPNAILVDENADVDLDLFSNNSFNAIPCNNPTQNVHSFAWGQVSSHWWNLLEAMHNEVQRVTRFSSLMMGQRMKSDSATEAIIQQQQGSAATDHKKIILQESLGELFGYLLGLMIEFYTEEKAFRLTDESPEYAFVDFTQMQKVPVMKPATRNFLQKWLDKNRGKEPPKWEIVPDKGGKKSLVKDLDLDIQITIGAGLPTNKAFLWQMAQQLSAVIIEGKNVVSWNEFREQPQQPQPQQQQVAGAPRPGQQANAGGVPPVGRPEVRNIGGVVSGNNSGAQ